MLQCTRRNKNLTAKNSAYVQSTLVFTTECESGKMGAESKTIKLIDIFTEVCVLNWLKIFRFKDTWTPLFRV